MIVSFFYSERFGYPEYLIWVGPNRQYGIPLRPKREIFKKMHGIADKYLKEIWTFADGEDREWEDVYSL